MTTQFGTYDVLPNKAGAKTYTHRINASLSANGTDRIVRIMLRPEQAARLGKSITGVITFAEEITDAAPAVMSADGTTVVTPAYAGGSQGYRFISSDNAREHELALAVAATRRTMQATAAQAVNTFSAGDLIP